MPHLFGQFRKSECQLREKQLAGERSLVQTSRRLRFSSWAEKSADRTPQQCATPLLHLGSGQREGNSAWLGRRGIQGRNGLPGKCAHCVKQREEPSRRGISREIWAALSVPSIRRPTKSASPSDAPGGHSASGASNPRSCAVLRRLLLRKRAAARRPCEPSCERRCLCKPAKDRSEFVIHTEGVGSFAVPLCLARAGEAKRRLPLRLVCAEPCAETKDTAPAGNSRAQSTLKRISCIQGHMQFPPKRVGSCTLPSDGCQRD